MSHATSRALQCLELRQLICKQIGRNDRRTLFRLSLSCKDFMDPALDEMWYEVDDFAFLLFSMPKDLYKVWIEWWEDIQQDVAVVSFQRPMLASDWKHLRSVAIRVRIFSHCVQEWGDFYRIDLAIFQSLACAAQGRTGLLPRLQQLTWITNDDIYPFIFLFLTPTITNIHFHAGQGNVASSRMRLSLLASLVSQCPSVTSVELCAGDRGDLAPSWRRLFPSKRAASTFAFFGWWEGLDSLIFRGMDLTFLIDAAAKLPALTKLKLQDCDAVDPLVSGEPVKGFPMLHCLCLRECDIGSYLYVLKRMSSIPLKYLDLHILVDQNESDWEGLFNNLQDSILRDSLTTVFFSVHDMDDYRPITLTLQTISPLFHFRHISHLTLWHRLNLGDIDVTHIAQAWPRLKLLELYPRAPRLPLYALIPFAMYCPQLEVLALRIDATMTVTDSGEPGNNRFERRLRVLEVYDSPIEHPALVAAFISDLFPNLKEISSVEENDDDYQRECQWREVERLVPVIATVRRQEANRKS